MKKIYLVLFFFFAISTLAKGQDTVFMAPVIIQFTTGDAGYPQAGDSIYTNSSLINESAPSIQVWRDHLLQYSVGRDLISFNDSTGAIQFHPALYGGERILIQKEEKQHSQ